MWIKLNHNHIEAFKRQWPCHGLPSSLHTLQFEFEANGDLCDIIAKARNGRHLDSSTFDGPALLALCDDAQHKMENSK